MNISHLLAGFVLTALMLVPAAPASADAVKGCADQRPVAGPTCDWLRYKQPWLFRTDSAVDKSRPPERSALPAPGSPQSYRFYKQPWTQRSTVPASGLIGYYPQPGTPEAFRCYKLGDCRKPAS